VPEKKIDQLFDFTGVSVCTSEYAGQMFFVPLQATTVSAIIATRTSERTNFLIVMVTRFTTLK